ncbi:hypothetical protein [Arthrobacter sp. RIT-PI-e]|uniref:hypothetical protein n=1 Tax=Arthrobacter sp. RIT-PI-e TaxID=1681197 RepID=UPI000AECA458|nr:hypothetical protein [Arthrobacter sp. RIT-PI-e]
MSQRANQVSGQKNGQHLSRLPSVLPAHASIVIVIELHAIVPVPVPCPIIIVSIVIAENLPFHQAGSFLLRGSDRRRSGRWCGNRYVR